MAKRKSRAKPLAIKREEVLDLRRSICDEMDQAIANLEDKIKITTKRLNTIMKVD